MGKEDQGGTEKIILDPELLNNNKEKEYEPQIPDEVREKLDGFTDLQSKYEKQNFNLGNIAKDSFYFTPEERDKIDKKRVTVDIDKHDTGDLSKTSFIKRIIPWQRKNVIGKGRETFDKTKLNDESKRGQATEVSDPQEKLDYLKRTGLPESEVLQARFEKIYSKDGALTKTIERDSTDQEKMEAAGKILDENLKRIKAGAGKDLFDAKTSLESFRKEKEAAVAAFGLGPEAIAKIQAEEEEMVDNIGMKAGVAGEEPTGLEKRLEDELKNYREGFANKNKELGNIISEFKESLSMAENGEKEQQKIAAALDLKIKKIEKMPQMKEVLKDDFDAWNKEKADAELCIKKLQEQKTQISDRLKVLNQNKTDIEKQLNEINGIGKTEKEIQKERIERIEKIKAKKAGAQKNEDKEKIPDGRIPTEDTSDLTTGEKHWNEHYYGVKKSESGGDSGEDEQEENYWEGYHAQQVDAEGNRKKEKIVDWKNPKKGGAAGKNIPKPDSASDPAETEKAKIKIAVHRYLDTILNNNNKDIRQVANKNYPEHVTEKLRIKYFADVKGPMGMNHEIEQDAAIGLITSLLKGEMPKYNNDEEAAKKRAETIVSSIKKSKRKN